MTKFLKIILSLSLGLFLIGLDQFSKMIAGRYGAVIFNEGVSFGWGQNFDQIFVVGMMLVLLGVVGWTLRQHRLAQIFVLSGGISNLLDRLQWEGVRDWILIPGGPIIAGWTGDVRWLEFRNNMADYWIVSGVIMVILIWTKEIIKSKRT